MKSVFTKSSCTKSPSAEAVAVEGDVSAVIIRAAVARTAVSNGLQVSLALLLLLASIFLTISPRYAFADEVRSSLLANPSAISVRVRSIHASSGESSTNPGAANQPSLKQGPVTVTVEKPLEDVASQLQKLPFREFSYVGSESDVIPLMRKQTLALRGGNQLTVRPLYIADGKVGVWLRWIDGSGMRVLDTRLQLVPGESMIAGTDGDVGSATILAIDVNPVSSTTER